MTKYQETLGNRGHKEEFRKIWKELKDILQERLSKCTSQTERNFTAYVFWLRIEQFMNEA